MSHDHPESNIYSEESHELGMAARHSISFPKHLRRPLLFDVPLQHPVQSLACHLSREHEQDLHLARRVYEGRICNAEGLWDQGKIGACMRDFRGGVVVNVGKRK